MVKKIVSPVSPHGVRCGRARRHGLPRRGALAALLHGVSHILGPRRVQNGRFHMVFPTFWAPRSVRACVRIPVGLCVPACRRVPAGPGVPACLRGGPDAGNGPKSPMSRRNLWAPECPSHVHLLNLLPLPNASPRMFRVLSSSLPECTIRYLFIKATLNAIRAFGWDNPHYFTSKGRGGQAPPRPGAADCTTAGGNNWQSRARPIGARRAARRGRPGRGDASSRQRAEERRGRPRIANRRNQPRRPTHELA